METLGSGITLKAMKTKSNVAECLEITQESWIYQRFVKKMQESKVTIPCTGRSFKRLTVRLEVIQGSWAIALASVNG